MLTRIHDRRSSGEFPSASRARFGWSLVAILLALWSPTALASSQISIPAEFLRFLNPPGVDNGLLRPSCLTVDRSHDEILVGDSGNHRVVIFDTQGRYRFEFSGNEHFASLSDLAVEPSGSILVLASTKGGRKLLRFDFDGFYGGEVPLGLQELAGARNFDLGEDGTIYLLNDHEGKFVITSFHEDGERIRSFAVMDESDEDSSEIVLGDLRVFGGKIYLPVSSEGRIKIFDLEGKLYRVLGSMGSSPGHFGFPVAVDVTDDGTILVLDKHRFNVLCFNRWGKFLGEFGGRGTSPGWFYFPSLLGVDGSDQVYIGQVFLNRVQTCAIPEVIRPHSSRNALPAGTPAGPSDEATNLSGVDTGAGAGAGRTGTAADKAALASGANSVVSNDE